MRFTLRQIEVFLAIAHFENVSRAAHFWLCPSLPVRAP